MPSIVISRSNEYTNRARTIKILVDGEVVDRISNGEVRKIHVEQGQHKIKAEIDWCGSREIVVDLSESDPVDLELSAFKYAGYIPLLALAIIFSKLIISRFTDNTDYFLFLLIPLALIMIYYFTLGRKRYLKLERTPGDRTF